MQQRGSWRTIAEELAGRIESGELIPGSPIETEERLAARLRVSRHTAHRALDELQRQGLLVRRPRLGTVVADRLPPLKRRLAYLVDFAESRFQAEILVQIEHRLDDGLRMVVSTSKNDPAREAENLRKLQHEVDGIISYPVDGNENAEAFQSLAASGFPLVLVDRAPRNCESMVVLTDNVQASKTAVCHLIGKGHRRIAFFGSNDDQVLSVGERFRGFRSAVAHLGYDSRPYERWIPLSAEDHPETTFQIMVDALIAMRATLDPPTAAFCVQDRLATGLIEACQALNLQIGVDFDIATYDDNGSPFVRQDRRLSRILQQVDVISDVALSRLNARMGGRPIPPGPIRIPAFFAPAEEPIYLLASTP